VKLDHVGIVVADIVEGRHFLTATFGIESWTDVFEEPGIGVLAQFGIGEAGTCYEIIAPQSADSPVSGALKRGTNILNHVAYLVQNLDAATGTLQELGCIPVVKPKPALAFGGNLVQFFQSPLRFLIELVEAPEHRHSFLASAKVHEGLG
jgi:methylmalonyl-CoA/ethylmalonyl-CoA epimerase